MVEEEGRGVLYEQDRLADAIARARGELEALRASLHAKADPAKAAIFAAHMELLDDPDFLEIANSAIAKGKSAAFAWRRAYTTYADRLAGLKNELLAQRANDLRDLKQRVLRALLGEAWHYDVPAGAIGGQPTVPGQNYQFSVRARSRAK